MAAAENYTVSGWKHGNQEYSGTLDLSTLSAEDFAALANDEENPLTITLTAVVKDIPTSTDDSGNGGDSGNNGGQESTPTPTPETTPTSTPSVTTVTAVAPTATPTATPAPTAEPTATPAPAAVSAHIPQTSDDMPYTLLVVAALASLCAAGALFMKRRSK
ncbi:MAG: LPXTG cell wall anchor domain-containing protein [Subdoligranulum variabile]|nr:LPXTG cell wall anchor domain-containing protein [Subdoligranulum variabile]